MEDRKKLLARLHIALHRAGAYENRQAIYEQYGEITAARLKEYQILDIIARLHAAMEGVDAPRTIVPATPDIKRLRSEVLAVLTRPFSRRGLEVPNDFSIINPIVLRYCGKSMPEMSAEELVKLRRQLCSIRDTGYCYDSDTGKFVKRGWDVATRKPKPVVVVHLCGDGTEVVN